MWPISHVCVYVCVLKHIAERNSSVGVLGDVSGVKHIIERNSPVGVLRDVSRVKAHSREK